MIKSQKQSFGWVFSLLKFPAATAMFVLRDKFSLRMVSDIGNRGESRLALFIPDGTPPHIVHRWVEPAFCLICGIVVAWQTWLPVVALFVFVAFALHFVEQTLYERSLSQNAPRTKLPDGSPVAEASAEDRLRTAADFFKRGLISQAEYDAKRQQILNKL